MSPVLPPDRPRSPFLEWLLLKSPSLAQPSSRSTEQGLTLLECLMAVVITIVTITLIAPPLLVATATRVKSQRSEQAFQLAQGEVDRIRTLVARGTHTADNLPVTSASANIQSTAAPSAESTTLESPNLACDTHQAGLLANRPALNRVLRVDVDGAANCQPEFLMQVFRSTGSTTKAESDGGTNRPDEFEIGVRVYWIGARQNLLANSLKIDAAPLGLTSGMGKQLTNPLVVLYMPMSWGDTNTSVCGYYQRAAQNADAEALCGKGVY